MDIEATKMPATTSIPQRVFLRVKRPYTQPPIKFFNAVNSKRSLDMRNLKRPLQQLSSSSSSSVNESALHPEKRTCFRYLGTAASLESSATASSSDLEVMVASGARRLVFTSTAPSVAQKRKADTATDSHFSQPQPPAPKSHRVMDLLYPESLISDPLTMTLKGLRLSATKAPPPVNVDPPTCGFVYDLYVSEADSGDNEGCNGEVFNMEGHSALVMEDCDNDDDDDDDDDNGACTWGGDSDDSNTESNWRNDYPDDNGEEEEEEEDGERFGAGDDDDDDDDDELYEYEKSDNSDAESGDDEVGIAMHRTAYYSDQYL